MQEAPRFTVYDQSNWYEFGDCLVLFPQERIPYSIIHFVGGFIAGSTIKIAYNAMLQRLARDGHLIIATEIPTFSLDHQRVAESIEQAFSDCYQGPIRRMLGSSISMIPIIGLSHSLGGKLTLLSNSLIQPTSPNSSSKKYGNIFISFNNFGFADSLKISKEDEKVREILSPSGYSTVPSLRKSSRFQERSSSIHEDNGRPPTIEGNEEDDDDIEEELFGFVSTITNTITDIFGESTLLSRIQRKVRQRLQKVEFIPSPSQTWEFFLQRYQVPHNYIIKFRNDEIDQSRILLRYFQQKQLFVELQEIIGNHLTPNLYQEERLNTATTDPIIIQQDQILNQENEIFMKTLLEVIERLIDSYHQSTAAMQYPPLPDGSDDSSRSKRNKKFPPSHPQRWDSDDY